MARPKLKELTVEEISKIRNYRRQGKTNQWISEMTGISIHRVSSLTAGIQLKRTIQGTAYVDGTVDCSRLISKKCLYGDTLGYCNYILVEGHRRGCDACCCDKFIEINPKDRDKIWAKKNVDTSWRITDGNLPQPDRIEQTSN